MGAHHGGWVEPHQLHSEKLTFDSPHYPNLRTGITRTRQEFYLTQLANTLQNHKCIKVVAFISVKLIILAQCFVSFAAEERLNIGVKKRVKLSSSNWKFMPLRWCQCKVYG
jgi:hypothetical protein